MWNAKKKHKAACEGDPTKARKESKEKMTGTRE